MLNQLHIKNFAIIDDLTINFTKGFNVLTGETGAGKTIIIEALNLVLGCRANTEMIRGGESQASVTAVFDLSSVSNLVKRILSEKGIDNSDELIIKRVISSDSKNKAFINGEAYPQQAIKEIALYLVDISSQHNQQSLLDDTSHIFIVDDFGKLEDLRSQYEKIYYEFISQRQNVVKLENQEKESKSKLEFIKYQIDELKAADLKENEEESLQEVRSRVKYSAKLKDLITASEEKLYSSPGSTVSTLEEVRRLLSKGAQYDSKLKEHADILENVFIQVSETGKDLKGYLDALSVDPAELESIEDRLHMIGDFKRKYGGTIKDVLNKYESLKTELYSIENYDEIIKIEKEKLKIIQSNLERCADLLSKKRLVVSKDLSQKIQRELQTLAMTKTTFHIKTDSLSVDECGPAGFDKIEFLISPNVGEPLRSLAKIVSGGELSRILLALKKVLADSVRLASTYIFDEVDSGVGGGVAEVIGLKLKEISLSHQTICITHLPQVACFGDSHYCILKKEKNGRTIALFQELDEKTRADEVARMLGGIRITEKTRAHALEMLKRG